MSSARTQPGLRALSFLAAFVLAVHVLLLQTAPARLGAQLTPEAQLRPVFSTRRIEAEPPPAALQAPARPVKPARQPKAKPQPPAPEPVEIQSNTALAPVEQAPAAIDSIASAPSAGDMTPNQPELPELASSQVAGTPTRAETVATALPAGPKTTPVGAIKLPASVRLDYRVTGNAKGLNYYANAELAWRNSGSQYEASMKVSALFLGARSMTSSGLVSATGLAPTRFADKYKTEQATHFEADKGKITFSVNSPDAPWIEGAQDRVSVFLQLGGMLAGQPDGFPAGSSITLYTAGPRDADTWTFTVEGEETVPSPKGDLRAIKLTRKSRREYDQKVEVWYAPSLGYLPVRNRITQQSGDFIDQQLTAVVYP